MRRGAWSDQEVLATLTDYFIMLKKEIRGEEFSKTAHRRALSQKLDGRSKTAIERKHMNISAVLHEIGAPFIDGYKPLGNYQRLLQEAVVGAIEADSDLSELIDEGVKSVPKTRFAVVDGERPLFVDPPVSGGFARVARDPSTRIPVRDFDYLERETMNRRLGKMGEAYVFDLERHRLSRSGRTDLAQRVEWTAKEKGDGYGYDIASFESNGEPIIVEVKTPNFHKRRAFMVTPKELSVSRDRSTDFRLYRVFDFWRTPGCFVLSGSIDAHCRLAPRLYSAHLG